MQEILNGVYGVVDWIYFYVIEPYTYGDNSFAIAMAIWVGCGLLGLFIESFGKKYCDERLGRKQENGDLGLFILNVSLGPLGLIVGIGRLVEEKRWHREWKEEQEEKRAKEEEST